MKKIRNISICIKTIVFFFSIVFFLSSSNAQNRMPPPEPKIGINFPFRPETKNILLFTNPLKESGARFMRQMTLWDVDWSQIQPGENNWNWIYADSSIKSDPGIKPIPTLFCISGKDSMGLQVPWIACKQTSCSWKAGRDSSATKNYIVAVIKRFKDYTNYWEVSNEMDANTKPPAGLSASDFANFLKLNYGWIKNADPFAMVLLPGLSGTFPSPLANKYQWLRDLLSSGGGAGFDIMNYHDYYPWWTLPCHYDSVKAVLNSFNLDYPIWVTESSTSSDPTTEISPNYSSENEQAADVWRRSAILFSKGAKKVFWHCLWSSGGATNPWREFGLIASNGQKKKSFHSYKLLTDKIENFTSVSALSSGLATENITNGGNGVWTVLFNCSDDVNRYVIWSPDKRPYTLTGLIHSAVKITEVVPKTLKNNGDSASFQTSKLQVNNGNVTFSNLTGLPILVEEDKTSPTKIKLSTPDNYASRVFLPLKLYWFTNTEGEVFHLQISKDASFANPVFENSNINQSSIEINNLLNSTTYYWRVRSSKDGFVGEWSDVWQFMTIVTKPGIPSLVTPSNGETKVHINPTFSWGGEGKGTTFQIQMSLSQIFNTGSIIFDSIVQNVTSAEIKGLKSNQLYYWKVKAYNESGESDWSTVWSFTTLLLTPDPPKLNLPLHNISINTTSIIFSWSNSYQATKYSFEIAEDSLFSRTIIYDTSLTVTTKSLNTLSENKIYWWRVKSNNNAGWSSFSEQRKFKIILPSSARLNTIIPTEYSLEQNYPNPFNPTTRINFSIPISQYAILKVYDFIGKEISTLVNEELVAGQYSIVFDGKNLSSGIYYYKLQTLNFSKTKIMQLIK